MSTLNQFTLHRIPKGALLPTEERTQGNQSISTYVVNLINWLQINGSSRTYDWSEDRQPEARNQILGMLNSSNANTDFARAAQALAERLKEKQDAVDGGAIDVQPGVLLCADVSMGGERLVLLAKLEFVDYLNDTDWVPQKGVPTEKNRPLKACYCYVGASDGEWIFGDIRLYDNQNPMSKFWWSDFLELTERTNNQVNSKRAYDAWMQLLSENLRKKHEADFLFLRSCVQFQFQTQKFYNHETMVASSLDNYVPTDPALDVPKLAAAARKLPEKHNRPNDRFDTQFELDASACRIRITRIPLSDHIQLRITGGLQDFRADIMPVVHKKEKGVFIVSTEGYEKLTAP